MDRKESKFFNQTIEQVFTQLNSDKNGLTNEQAEQRLSQNGKNKLNEHKKTSVFVMFLLQFKNVMTLILLVAAIISVLHSGWVDFGIIMFVVLLNAVLGVIQESKAERAIEALQKLSGQMAKVRRNGKVLTISAEDLVVGDIVILEAGDSVSADMRLIESRSLRVEEASLTGESLPSEKNTEAIELSSVGIGDRDNMVFMGTNVTYGRGEGVVVATGMNTEMGAIADILMKTKDDITPLQRQMDKLGKILSVIILGICALIFVIDIFHHGWGIESVSNSLLTAVSLAVAAIPEGLTTVITVIMTLGVTRMSKRNAIIRKLPAIETLGCTEVICSDKTGTLTQNKMNVVKTFSLCSDERMLNITAVLCNDSIIEGDKVLGDPTETALVVYGRNNGVDKNEIERIYTRLNEVPFDSERKLMSTVNRFDDDSVKMFVKGASDELIKKCKYAITDDGVVEFSEQLRQSVSKQIAEMSKNALRVLGFAYKDGEGLLEQVDASDESELIFAGLMGMIDPVRPEVKDAVSRCVQAGITPVMITGDHKITAIAIGKELGIITDESQAISGAELDKLSDEEFDKMLYHYRIYARVSPENKVRIVTFFKKRGKITAMTGDGVNDAPALKTANIGVGMGITGTDVVKNVADMVLADDNFNTIVVAVEEGRIIYNNIRKAVQFLLSSNFCEIMTLFIATLFNFNILTAVQILWVNLVTDSLPALALGIEKAETDIMRLPPRDSNKGIFADGLGRNLAYQSVLLTGLVIGAFLFGKFAGGGAPKPEVGMTMAFLVLSLSQLFHAYNLKSANKTIFGRHIFDNKLLNLSTLGMIAMMVSIIYIPFVNSIFNTVPLNAIELLMVFVFAFSIVPLVELAKLIIGIVKRGKTTIDHNDSL